MVESCRLITERAQVRILPGLPNLLQKGERELKDADFDPCEQAAMLIYRYLSVQYHWGDMSKKGQSDPGTTDNHALNVDLENIMSRLSLCMRDLGNLARGISHVLSGPADKEQLCREVRETCRHIYQIIGKRYCPPPFKQNTAWEDFCWLVADILGEDPVFGKTRTYELTAEQHSEQMFYHMRQSGKTVRFPGIIGRLFGRKRVCIELDHPTAI